jgi:DNA-binding beta-propeller fold protein YncE
VPADVSVIAIVNKNSDEVVGSIPLNKKNPGAMSVFGGKMLVASSGDYYDDAIVGGVELINLASNANEGIIVDGTMSAVLFVSADKAYAGKMPDAGWSMEIFTINPSTKSVGQNVSGIGDGSGGMAYDGTKVYIGDRGFGSSGIAVVNPQTDTVEEIIATELPPTGLAVIK